MKVLLVNPGFTKKLNLPPTFHVGLLSLGSFLESKGFEVELLDCLTQKWKGRVRGVDDDTVVGLSVMTNQIPEALKITRMIKESSSAKVVWGGTHPSLCPAQVAENELVDFAVHGEGELTFLELLRGLKNKTNFNNIKGLAFRKKSEVRVTGGRELCDLNELPSPNWGLVDSSVRDELDMIRIETSRACPGRCRFCIHQIFCNPWRSKNSNKVLKEVESATKQFKTNRLMFVDSNFFVNRERTVRILEGLKDYDLSWMAASRIDYFSGRRLDDAVLKKLKDSGLFLLDMGAESGSQKVLNHINKDITVKQIIHSARQCNKYGIKPLYSFMLGLPGERRKDIWKTFHLIDRIKKIVPNANFSGPHIFRPFPSGDLFEECKSLGWEAPDSLEEWDSHIRGLKNHVSVRKYPWVEDPDFVDSTWPFVYYGANDLGRFLFMNTIDVNSLLKLGFALLAKLRWKLKYFKHPIEYRIAKKYLGF